MQQIKAILRLLTKMEQAPERFVTNYTFVNKEDLSLIIFPVKSDDVCRCGKKATFLMEDPMCVDCFNKLIDSSVLNQEKALIFPSLEKSVKSSAFEWSPNSGESWYKIHGRNIIPDSTIVMSDAEKKKRFLEIMEKVLLGQPQPVECEYNKDEKKFIVFV